MKIKHHPTAKREILPLNQEQEAASKQFMEFLLTDEKEMIISGPGGSGKTVLLGNLIDCVLPQYHDLCKIMGMNAKYMNIDMTATTNKAADVLSSATGKSCGTVYSFMNLKVMEDYSTGRTNIKKSNSWMVHRNQILVVDEAYMIDTPLRNHILEGTADCKILYVGDHAQLAPVKELTSPISKQNLREAHLTKVMRTDSPDLRDLNYLLRKRAVESTFGDIQLIPGVIDHLSGYEMEKAIANSFINQGCNDRVLAYTNQRVLDYNEHIRELRGLPNHIVAGEHMICNSMFMPRTSTTSQAALSVDAGVVITRAELPHMLNYQNISGMQLLVQECDFIDDHGNVFEDVLVPVDKLHYLELIKYFAREKNWPVYFDLKNSFPDLRERDSGTVHKAQGSSYDTVFIDLENISTCNRPDIVARLLYVACSRARKRIVFYGELASKYGRLVR